MRSHPDSRTSFRRVPVLAAIMAKLPQRKNDGGKDARASIASIRYPAQLDCIELQSAKAQLLELLELLPIRPSSSSVDGVTLSEEKRWRGKPRDARSSMMRFSAQLDCVELQTVKAQHLIPSVLRRVH
jgi:hypothetical protein